MLTRSLWPLIALSVLFTAHAELPPEPSEIKPHPKGIELGTLIQMLERTKTTQLGAFFKKEFCRVGPNVAKEICTSFMTGR